MGGGVWEGEKQGNGEAEGWKGGVPRQPWHNTDGSLSLSLSGSTWRDCIPTPLLEVPAPTSVVIPHKSCSHSQECHGKHHPTRVTTTTTKTNNSSATGHDTLTHLYFGKKRVYPNSFPNQLWNSDIYSTDYFNPTPLWHNSVYQSDETKMQAHNWKQCGFQFTRKPLHIFKIGLLQWPRFVSIRDTMFTED